MAKTDEGKKIVHVPSHTKDDGTPVKEHYRSTPNPAKPQPSQEEVRWFWPWGKGSGRRLHPCVMEGRPSASADQGGRNPYRTPQQAAGVVVQAISPPKRAAK